jgi:hypothetical protein
MRERDRILGNLEGLYREAFGRAQEGSDEEGMSRLDFDFQRDQLYLEVLLDLREVLATLGTDQPEEKGKTSSLLEKAQAIRKLTKLR